MKNRAVGNPCIHGVERKARGAVRNGRCGGRRPSRRPLPERSPSHLSPEQMLQCSCPTWAVGPEGGVKAFIKHALRIPCAGLIHCFSTSGSQPVCLEHKLEQNWCFHSALCLVRMGIILLYCSVYACVCVSLSFIYICINMCIYIYVYIYGSWYNL